jgi:5-methylcytosine-specific restriction endonuclease McrA
MQSRNGAKGNILKMKCDLCKDEIDRTSPRQLYCPSCSLSLHLERSKIRNAKNYNIKIPIVVCKKCGKNEISTSPKQKFCKKHMCYGRKMNARKGNIIRRARINSIFHDFSYDNWLNKIEESMGICPGYKCEPHFVGKENLSLDHIKPISKVNNGFIYKITDVQPLCHSCNSKKSNKVLI